MNYCSACASWTSLSFTAHGGLTLSYGSASDAGGGYAGLDRFGRVVDQKWTVDGVAVDEFRYGYDRSGNRTFRENVLAAGKSLDEWYTYDGLDRLISSSRGTLGGGSFPNFSGIIAVGNGSQSWSLDQLGNWAGSWQDADGDGVVDEGEGQTRTANAANEIGAITGRDAAEPVYDAAGNMTFDGRQHYVYDAWNRMVAAYANDDGDLGNQIARYEYDGRGYRVAKAVALHADAEHPATVTGYDRTDFFYNESWQAVEQRLSANSPSPSQGEGWGEGGSTDYVWDQSYIDTPVLRIRTAGQSSESLYYAVDANKNVTALVDPTDGSVAERYVYSPYGEATTYADNWSTTVTWENSQQNDRQYCGYVLNAEIGCYYSRARYYEPTLGQWISRDPAGYEDDARLYAYVHGHPTTGADPIGLWDDMTNTGGSDIRLGLQGLLHWRVGALLTRKALIDADKIQPHSSFYLPGESPIVLTCRGGFVDIGHVRETADNVLSIYLDLRTGAAKKTRIHAMHNDFVLTKDVPNRDRIGVAASMAYDDQLLYEAQTATGELRNFAARPEWPGMLNSSFSPEDLPSDFIGVHAALTILDKVESWVTLSAFWGDLMDDALEGILGELVPVPKAEAERAFDTNVAGRWVRPRINDRGPLKGVANAMLGPELLRRNSTHEPWLLACLDACEKAEARPPRWLTVGPSLMRDYYRSEIPRWDLRGTESQWRITGYDEDIEKRIKEVLDELARSNGGASHFTPSGPTTAPR